MTRKSAPLDIFISSKYIYNFEAGYFFKSFMEILKFIFLIFSVKVLDIESI